MKKIYLFDIVDEWMLKNVRDILEKADEQGEEKFKVYINSPGGSVYDGITIYNLFKERDVTMEVTGIAASMASYIACAGKQVTIRENAVIMIHKPWTMAAGNSDDMEKIQENLEMLEDIISTGYAKQSGMDQGDILDMMEEETWLTADQALEKGFVDSVVEDDEEQSLGSYKDYFNMVNMAHNKKGEDMDEVWAWLKEFFNLKSEKPDEEGIEELKGAVEELEDARGDGSDSGSKPQGGEEPKTENQKPEPKIEDEQYNQVVSQMQEMKKKMEAMEKEKNQAKIDNLIQSAVSDGKILPAQKEVWINSAKADFDGTKEKLDAIPKNSVMPRGVNVTGNKKDDMKDMDMADYFRMFGENGDKGGING